MKDIKVLLICGSGASSGFMAINMRKAVKERGINADVIARGESEIENYIDEIGVLMIGPHLEYLTGEIDDLIRGYPIKVILMKPEYYSSLDGNAAIDHLIEESGLFNKED